MWPYFLPKIPGMLSVSCPIYDNYNLTTFSITFTSGMACEFQITLAGQRFNKAEN